MLWVLAIPEVEAAAVALMGFYVKNHGAIFAALSEVPMPTGPLLKISGREISKRVVGNRITHQVIRNEINHNQATFIQKSFLNKWAKDHKKIVEHKREDYLNHLLRIVHSAKTEEQLLRHIAEAKKKYGTQTMADYGPL